MLYFVFCGGLFVWVHTCIVTIAEISGLNKGALVNNLNKVSNSFLVQSILGSVMIALPLLVVPSTEQFVIHSKIVIFLLATLLVMVLYIVHSIRKSVLPLTLSPLTFSILGFGVASIASSFFANSYPVEHLFGLGGLYFACCLFILFGASQVKTIVLEHPLNILLGVNAALFATSVLQLVGFGPARLLNYFLPLPLALNSLAFNLSGSPLIALQIAGIALVGVGSAFILKQYKLGTVQYIGLGFTLASILLHTWAILPGKESTPLLLPLAANWSIAIDTLRTPKTAFFGYGPQGFSTAYSLFKPEWINSSSLWATPFAQGSNGILTLLVTTGLLGVGSFLSIPLLLVRQYAHMLPRSKPVFWMILSIFVLMCIVPANTVLFGLLAVLITTWIGSESKRFTRLEIQSVQIRKLNEKSNEESTKTSTSETPAKNRIVVQAVCAVIAFGLIVATYGYGRAFAAEVVILQSTKAIQNEDLIGAYILQQRAIKLNPFIDSYRRRYSATNITIAAALAEKTDLTDEEASQFSALVQQSIREGRAATALNQLNSTNWLHLAQVYRSLIGAAEGSEQWALTSYLTAAQLAPTDPALRVEIGGILYAAESYDDAALFFQQAIALKPDYANAYYNLANTFVMANKLEQARTAYQQTLLLLNADTQDYVRTSNELKVLEEKIDASPTSAQQNQENTELNATNSVQDQLNLNQINQGQPSLLTNPGENSFPIISAENQLPLGELTGGITSQPTGEPANTPTKPTTENPSSSNNGQ